MLCSSLRLSWRFAPARFVHSATTSTQEIRANLQSQLLSARKARDALSTRVLRSVLSEVQAADKTRGHELDSDAIYLMIRKGITQRREAGEQFASAGRDELAANETQEADYLSTILPPQLSEAQVDAILLQVSEEHGELRGNSPTGNEKAKGRLLGQLLKGFASQIDKSQVDFEIVARRAKLFVEQSRS